MDGSASKFVEVSKTPVETPENPSSVAQNVSRMQHVREAMDREAAIAANAKDGRFPEVGGFSTAGDKIPSTAGSVSSVGVEEPSDKDPSDIPPGFVPPKSPGP